MFETGDALPVLKFEWPQRNSSLQAKDHPKFAQRDALPVRQQINLVVEVIGLVEEAIKALEKRAPAEEEVNLIEAFVTTEFVKDESATSNAVTRLVSAIDRRL